MTASAWGQEYIAVDWGSTNRRAYRLANDGKIIDSFEDELGVLVVAKTGFDQPVAQIRERLGDVPMLLAGMIGSNKGWHEATYVACPASVEDITSNILWIDDRTGIVPGVSQNHEPDVMRGEEVQVIGAIGSGNAPPDGLICHPGTHAKWIVTAGGRIQSFHTAMTGEMFSLLKRHSVLSDLLQGSVTAGPAFDAGVNDAIQLKPLLSALFGIRARYLLTTEPVDYASYASGLLIGADVIAAIGQQSGAAITLVGRPDLCELYARAASLSGRNTVAVDGADAFITGMTTISGHLR